ALSLGGRLSTGTGLKWAGSDHEQLSRSTQLAAIGGSWFPHSDSVSQISMSIDGERDLANGNARISTAAELRFHTLVLRAGVSRSAEGPGLETNTSAAAGLGLGTNRFQFDLALSRIGDAIAQ